MQVSTCINKSRISPTRYSHSVYSNGCCHPRPPYHCLTLRHNRAHLSLQVIFSPLCLLFLLSFFFFFKSGIYLYCCKRSLPGFSPVLPLLCCQSSAPPNPRNHHCSCLEGRGLGGATGAMPEFALAAEKKGGWEYSGFNTFLMTKVLSLGTHDLLRQQHQKTVLFFALQKS